MSTEVRLTSARGRRRAAVAIGLGWRVHGAGTVHVGVAELNVTANRVSHHRVAHSLEHLGKIWC